MPRRREIGSIANGLAGSFISRSNATDGYWMLGKLYAHALRKGTTEIAIDLLAATLTPPDLSLEEVALTYRRRLFDQLFSKKMSASWVASAILTVRFSPSGGPVAQPFECRVSISDDLGREHAATTKGRCWPHDPARETRGGPGPASTLATIH